MKPTTRQLIRQRLHQAGRDRALAIHEFAILSSSQNAQSARVREMHGDGELEGRIRSGEAFKEWRLTEKGFMLAENEKHLFAVGQPA